jgi:hypothetical protein
MRRIAALLLGSAALLVLGAGLAQAAYKYPPGPPFRPFCASLPDSINLYSIEQTDTTLAPCHPATLDTVLGVRGIITGFDAKASAYGFYIQNGTGPWAGADIFTGSTNYNSAVPGTPTGGNLALGDSVVIYGTTQEFPTANGTTEIEGPDAIQNTNDIIIRRISSGNPLPPIHVGTCHELEWLPAFSQAEQWEGLIVKIRGPLTVGRTSGTGIQSPNFLLTDGTSDSVLVDGFTLTTLGAAPTVGTIVDSIVGIVNQNTSSSGTGSINSYRIQIRSGNDLYLAVPPSLTDAYSIEDNQLRLVFDRNVDPATATLPGKYSLASAIDGSTVNTASLETTPGNVVILGITSVLNHGDLETVGVSGVGSAGCPSCTISPQQTRSFFNGVLSLAEVQTPDPAFLPLFDDRSRFSGTGSLPGGRLTYRGIEAHQFGSVYYMVDLSGAQRGGLGVFGPTQPLLDSHKYRVVGAVQEFGSETEGTQEVYITDEGLGTLPTPISQTVHVLRDTTTDQTQSVLTGEDFEACLVKLNYVRVTEPPATVTSFNNSFFVAGPIGAYSDTMLVSNLSGALTAYTPVDSGSIVNVTGILHFTGGTFRICPRSPSDIVLLGSNTTGVGGPQQLSFSVAPNPARVSTISFALPRASHVDLGVFDLQGRQVAQIFKGDFPAGSFSRAWNGTDASGKRVNPGVYFYRLKAGPEVRIVRGVLLQ